MSDSPDMGTESLGKLRSSSATQEKLQYPLGTPAALLPPDGSPAITANAQVTFKVTLQKQKRNNYYSWRHSIK